MVCVDIGIVKFGSCSTSPSANAKIDVQKVSKQVASSIMNSINEENSVVVSSQNQNVSVKGSCCSPIIISQEANMKIINTTKMDIKMITDIANSFKKDMIKEVDSATSGLKNILGPDVGTRLTATMKKSIENVTSSTNFKQSIQKKMSETFANQGQNINIDCGETLPTPTPPPGTGLPDTGCYISQSFLMEQVSNNIMETMMSDISADPQMDAILSEISKSKIKVETSKRGGLEKEEVSWWISNKNMIIVVLLVFLIPLLVKILFG